MKKKSNPQILFITNEGFDTPGPNNFMTERIIRGFLDQNYTIRLIQSFRNGPKASIPISLSKYNNLECINIKKRQVSKTSFKKRFIYDVTYIFRVISKWLFYKSDMVILQSTPTSFLHIFLLKIFFKRKIIFNIYDIFPGHSYDLGIIKNRFLFQTFKFLYFLAYKFTKKIVVLSEDMKISLVKSGVENKKVIVIPPWFDIGNVFEKNRYHNRFTEKYRESDFSKFIVQYAGSIGQVFDYHPIIEAARILSGHTDIVFHIIGNGPKKDSFYKIAIENDLKNILFFPLQDIDLVSDVYSTSNICVIPLRRGVIRAGVPSKAPIIMACRRTIIILVESDSKYFNSIKNNNIGIAINNDESSGINLANEILDAYKNPHLISIIASVDFCMRLKSHLPD